MRFNAATGKLEDDEGNEIAMAAPPGMAPQPQVPGAGVAAPAAAALTPQVQAPPPVPSMVRESQSTTTSREIPLAGERDAMKRLQRTDEEAVKIAEREGEAKKHKAESDADDARTKADTRERFADETTSTVDQTSAEVAKAKATYDAESKRLAESKTSDWWTKQTTGQKIMAVIGLALSGVGSALAGRGGGGQAAAALEKEIEDDYRLSMAKLDNAKAGIGVARQNASDARGDVELKQAARWKAVEAKITEQAAQNGTEQAAVEAEKLRNVTQAKQQEHLQRWFETQRPKVSTTSASSAGGAGAAGTSKPSSEDLAKIGSLDNDIKNIDRMIDTVKKNPGAWNEYAKNQESWARSEALGKTKIGGELRGISQAAGAANVTPEQGLRSPEAKQIHQGLQGVKVGIAKGYGGVITGGDLEAAGSEITTMANDPKQATETLLRLRDRMANSRDVYLRNRNVQANPTAPAPSAGGGPAGAKVVTQRDPSTGRTRRVRRYPDGREEVLAE